MNDSVEAIVGTCTAVAPDITVRNGYIGQLYEVTSLVVTASPASVSEDGTSQLGAIASIDDATVLVVPGSDVSWGAAAFPIAAINANGLATPAAVYTDTFATVSGYYLGASNSLHLLVLDTNPDNYGLYASDGIPDSWQVQHFGPDSPSGVATADPDGDRYDNLQEYQAGTDPTKSASALRITAIAREGDNIRVSWTCAGGHSYVLQSTEPFAPAGCFSKFVDTSPLVSVAGVGESTTNYLDVGAADAPVLTPPGGPIPTSTGMPSVVDISAVTARGLADASSHVAPIGSVLMIGSFAISEAAIQSDFNARNLSAIMAAFTPYGEPLAVGDGTGVAASWDVPLSAVGFAGRKIYLLAVDKPTLAAATQLGIFTAPSWVFPEDGGEIFIDLEDVTDFVVGAHDGPLTVNLPLGQTYTFDDSARLTALPGRGRFYRVRLGP
ncbi:MAG TPA: hypothetical protein VL486_03260 [Verrucomicrobiae bacterium]|nr:hypothetical protein [Verrucomicrobiae bacterium]